MIAPGVRWTLASIVPACAAIFLAACGSSSSGGFSGFDGGSTMDATVEAAPPAFTIQVTPAQDSEVVVLGGPAKSVTFKALRSDPSSATPTDVSAQVTWSTDNPQLATSTGNGSFALSGLGGKAQIVAALGAVQGSAPLTVKLTGAAYLGGTTSSAAQAFMGATPDPNPQDAPTLEYPLDGVVLPGNVPPIEWQWTQAADNDLYRVHLVTQAVLDVEVYTMTPSVVADAPTWAAVVATAADLPSTWTVDATGPSKMLRTSAPQTMTIAGDRIDNSAIYAWQSSTGTFHVLDMTKGTDIVLPNNSASLQAGQPCSGCHRISRDGKRFAFTFNGGNFNFGTLAFDPMTNTFLEKVAPSPSYRGTYATFNPLEATEGPSMLVTQPDSVPENTAGTVRLELRHPDTNAVVPSNLAAMQAQLGALGTGSAASMPDWAPDGSFVVFAAYDSSKNFVRLLGDDIVLASIVESPVSFQSGIVTFGAPKVLVAANSADNPDTGQNNFLPAISPDGSVVALTRAAGWWSIKTQQSLLNLSGQIVMVRRADGQVIELVNGSNGAGTTLSSTWPQWAPTIGQKYAWLAYGSERPYGHELTPTNMSCGPLVQGQGSCKQLWVMALDLTKMKSGTADPSFAPFWIPAQSIHAQYVSPQWTKAVLPPPK